VSEVVTVGLDIAKSVFQVHGVDVAGEVAIRRQIRRAQVLAFFAKLSSSSCTCAHPVRSVERSLVWSL
jgi:transposase